MRPYSRVIVTFSILIVLVLGLYFFSDWFSKTTGYVLGEAERIKLAQCLTEKSVVLYISEGCPACEQQLELFGTDAASFLIVQTCSTAEECPYGTPAWNINGKPHVGVQSLEQLILTSECYVQEP